MEDFETLLNKCAKAHGHLCPGQVIGVRMAMLGCKLIEFDEPRSLPQIKNLIVYVEIDRCATDAISFVTGAKIGRRSMKIIDNGIMAATFVNLKTQKAFRIVAIEEARKLASEYDPDISDKRQRQISAYKKMDIDQLFTIEEVFVDIPACDMPGPTKFKAVCAKCNTVIRDKREVLKNNQILCKPCAFGAYYESIKKKGEKNVRDKKSFAR